MLTRNRECRRCHPMRATSVTPRARFLAVITALAMTGIASAALVATAAPNADAASYRYWSYWSVSAQPSSSTPWKFATSGAASRIPKDGEVEGWRFSVSSGAGAGSRPPRIAAATAFSALCGSTGPVVGSKRVAVAIDYGVPIDAPAGQSPPAARGGCVVVALTATGATALTHAPVSASLRVKDGLICGIDGYPTGPECAPVISDPTTPRATASSKPAPITPTSTSSDKARTPVSPTPPATTNPPSSPVTVAPSSSTDSAAASSPGASESPIALSTTAPTDSGSSGSPAGVLVAGLGVASLGGLAWFLSARGRS